MYNSRDFQNRFPKKVKNNHVVPWRVKTRLFSRVERFTVHATTLKSAYNKVYDLYPSDLIRTRKIQVVIYPI